MRLGKARLQFQCPAVRCDRFVQLPLFLQRAAQVVACIGIVQLQFQSPAVTGNRFVQLPLVIQGSTQIVVRLGKVRLQLQCPVIAGDGFVQLPLFLQRTAQVAMEDSLISLQPDCASNVFDGNLMLADLVSDDTEKMPRIGMIRLDRENLPIDLLSGLQPTGLVVLNRSRHCFGNRCHNVNYGNFFQINRGKGMVARSMGTGTLESKRGGARMSCRSRFSKQAQVDTRKPIVDRRLAVLYHCGKRAETATVEPVPTLSRAGRLEAGNQSHRFPSGTVKE